MKAKIFIKYKEGILDPQGTVTNKALKSIDIKGIESIGIGKYIEINFKDNIDKDSAKAIAEDSCKKMLANPNTETYSFIIEE
jgi:phosphoribosylformylglycinamidine synthase